MSVVVATCLHGGGGPLRLAWSPWMTAEYSRQEHLPTFWPERNVKSRRGLHRASPRRKARRPRGRVHPAAFDLADSGNRNPGRGLTCASAILPQWTVSASRFRVARSSGFWIERMWQDHHDENADGPARRQCRHGRGFRASGGSEGHRPPPPVGYMSQAFSLYGELTVRQNLDLHGRLFGMADTEVAPRIEELTRRFGLSSALDNLRTACLWACVSGSLWLWPSSIARHPDPRRADIGVDPVARDDFWAYPGGPLPLGQCHHFCLDPFHERSRTLRSHFVDACRPGARDGHAEGDRGKPEDGKPGRAFIAYLEQAIGEASVPTENSQVSASDTVAGEVSSMAPAPRASTGRDRS